MGHCLPRIPQLGTLEQRQEPEWTAYRPALRSRGEAHATLHGCCCSCALLTPSLLITYPRPQKHLPHASVKPPPSPNPSHHLHHSSTPQLQHPTNPSSYPLYPPARRTSSPYAHSSTNSVERITSSGSELSRSSSNSSPRIKMSRWSSKKKKRPLLARHQLRQSYRPQHGEETLLRLRRTASALPALYLRRRLPPSTRQRAARNRRHYLKHPASAPSTAPPPLDPPPPCRLHSRHHHHQT